MKKYLLVGGSITAVLLIVLASFTSVVGYSSGNTTVVVDSPLFKMRVNTFIHKKDEKLESTHIGENREIHICIHPVKRREVQFEKIINYISTLDDENFDKLVRYLEGEISNVNSHSEFDSNEVLRYIRDNPQILKHMYSKVEGKDASPEASTIGNWVPLCLLESLLRILFAIILFIYIELLLFIDKLIPTSISNCPTVICTN